MAEAEPEGGDVADAVHARMMAALPSAHGHPELDAFYRLLHAYPARRGKMLRGRLLVHAADAFDADRAASIGVAAALELFQNWVLVHDDIEDDSHERRGGPALHREIGMPLALNVGDALHVYMWDLLHHLDADPRISRAVREEFLHMIHRTAEGQHLDLVWVAERRFDVTEEDYLRMVVLKTSWYTVTAPLRLGAHCAGTRPHPALDEAGADLGAAFQIRDDVLNLTADAGGYGKEFAGDLYEGKRTLVLAHAFASADADEKRELATRLTKARTARTPEDVTWILDTLSRHGSIAYAQERAETLAARGLDALTRGLADAPNRAAAARVVELLAGLAARRA